MSDQNKYHSLSPKFFFLSLGVLVTLITSVTTALNLFFNTLTKKMPDVLNSVYQYGYSSYDYESMRSLLATLIIIFPIFLLISFFWWKEVKSVVEGWNKIIFKWMIYLILFLSTIVFVVDLVTLVNYFVSGEITNRFIYKVLGAAALAAIVWGSYYLILKGDFKNKTNKVLMYFYKIISIILFFAIILFSFNVMGSPAKQRAFRLDERRVNDLESIQWQVINYWQNKKKLPATLNDLKDPISGTIIPLDPEFSKGLSYEYTQKDKLSFELCATFSDVRQNGLMENSGNVIIPMYSDKAVSSNTIYPYTSNNDSWDHGIGRVCFDRNIDPEIYRPIENVK